MKNIDNYNSGDYFPRKEEDTSGLKAWLNQNGEPDYNYLQTLASAKTPESFEELMLVADDLDVDYHSSISADDLVERIRLKLSGSDTE